MCLSLMTSVTDVFVLLIDASIIVFDIVGKPDKKKDNIVRVTKVITVYPQTSLFFLLLVWRVIYICSSTW